MVDDRQVIIFFDTPKGQLIQTTYQTFKEFYSKLGWQLLGQPREMFTPDNMPARIEAGQQGLLL